VPCRSSVGIRHQRFAQGTSCGRESPVRGYGGDELVELGSAVVVDVAEPSDPPVEGGGELGYMELHRRGAELLFQVLTEREEKNCVAIASNESFSGWTKTFTDPRLCAAIVDRLTFGGHIIETGSQSDRLATTLARQAL